MKKFLGLLAALCLLLASVTALAADGTPEILTGINGQIFEFSSGVGAWGTELTFQENGLFTGVFHDSEMGETGEGYPDGSVYGCSFHGQLSDLKQADEYTWTAALALEPDEGQVPEAIEDGIRYVTAAPYGLEKATSVTLFVPGTPVERLPEGFLPWSHLQDIAPDAKEIPYYAIWSAEDEAGFISSGETAAPQKITGAIENGSYVLTVRLDAEEAGEWQADEMAQDASVVKLAESHTADGCFIARYEPTGDGEVSVHLRRIHHQVCAELHSFDLRVKDGMVQEVTGGSYTAAPNEAEQDPWLSGEWLEKDTQFITLSAAHRDEGGWNVEFTSPLTHGAWVLRATAYYDCEEDAFVYADGVRYDLLPSGEMKETESAKDLWGRLTLIDSPEDGLHLDWYDMDTMNGETVCFEKSVLPAYTYTGEDPIEGAVADWLASDELASRYLTVPGSAAIPCPILHRTEKLDDTHVQVYGTFWILNYVQRGNLLYAISGGEDPAVLTLEQADGAWRVTALEEAGDGEDYTADIQRFAQGDPDLESRYFAAADLGAPENQAIRTRYIRAYVEANQLNITAYQDFGWDPIPLQ